MKGEIAIYDKKNMLSLLKDFPKHCLEGYNFKIPEVKGEFDKIVFTGMGGSAIAGDILKVLLENFSKIPVFVIRDYELPEFVDSKTLIVVESYSGNTEETISTYRMAKKKNGIIFCVSSDGEIEKMAKEDNLPFVKIPSGMPPRCALGYLLFPVYKLFVEYKILPQPPYNFFEKIEKWAISFYPENGENKALQIAKKFYKKIPLIYSENKFYPGILRWKTQIAENSKQFSFINLLPEMNHNEIMSFTYPEEFIKNLEVVFIISNMENERVKKRIEITSDIISKKIKREVLKLELEGNGLFEKMIYLIILGDWISFYLAILNKMDPTEIKEIDILKDSLKGGN